LCCEFPSFSIRLGEQKPHPAERCIDRIQVQLWKFWRSGGQKPDPSFLGLANKTSTTSDALCGQSKKNQGLSYSLHTAATNIFKIRDDKYAAHSNNQITQSTSPCPQMSLAGEPGALLALSTVPSANVGL